MIGWVSHKVRGSSLDDEHTARFELFRDTYGVQSTRRLVFDGKFVGDSDQYKSNEPNGIFRGWTVFVWSGIE